MKVAKICVATIGVAFFVRFNWGALFLYADGGYMNKNMQEKIIDITGVELTPGEPSVCLGNREQGFECCCDECDYFLLCFPEFDSKSETINKTENPQTLLWQKQRKGTFDINISKAYAITFRKVEKSLPCAKGGGTACRDGGIVKDWFFAQNNPSVASRQLPLHKGAFDTGTFSLYISLAFSHRQ